MKIFKQISLMLITIVFYHIVLSSDIEYVLKVIGAVCGQLTISNISSVLTIISFLPICFLVCYGILTYKSYKNLLFYNNYGELVGGHYNYSLSTLSNIHTKESYKLFDNVLMVICGNSYLNTENLYNSTRDKNYFERNNKKFIIKKLNERVCIINKIKNTEDEYKKLKYCRTLNDMLSINLNFYNAITLEAIIKAHNDTINRINDINIISKKSYFKKYKDELKDNDNKLRFIRHQGVFVDVTPSKLNNLHIN